MKVIWVEPHPNPLQVRVRAEPTRGVLSRLRVRLRLRLRLRLRVRVWLRRRLRRRL